MVRNHNDTGAYTPACNLSPLQGSDTLRKRPEGPSAGLLTSPIYRINAQNDGLQKERELCVHFYRTPIKTNEKPKEVLSASHFQYV